MARNKRTAVSLLNILLTDLNGKCSGILTQPSGTISSFDGDNDGLYDENLNCIWTIIAPEHYVIRLEFLIFELEYDEDCVDRVQVGVFLIK